MLRLTTFGALAVHRDGTALGGAASQRRRLALLAVLAASGDRGVPRDKLVTYFWPESDEKHARHSLTQALYSLGRDLRENELVVGTADLRLNAAVMSSDVGDFTAAAATGDDLRAVTLYADPFLDGCHLADAPEFERWADAERARLAATARAALERLATADTRAGDHARAADWWRRLAALEPLDARVAAGYMTALALAGNTTGAIQHARVHEAVVRAELDAPPDAAVTRLAEQLRTGGAAAIAPPGPARAVAPASRAGPGIASPSRRLSLAMLFTMRRSSPQRLMTTTVTHEVSAARTAARRAMMRRAAAGIAVGALAAALWALLAS